MTSANKSSRKVIITCAVTGSIHTPSMSPHLPVTPKEIADAAVAAAEAGAAIVHQHDADGATSAARTAEQSLETYQLVLAERPDAIGLTVPGMPLGSPGMEQRDGKTEPYDVLLIKKDGSTEVFANH